MDVLYSRVEEGMVSKPVHAHFDGAPENIVTTTDGAGRSFSMEEVQTLQCLTAKHETQQNQLSTSTVQSGISANASSIIDSLLPGSLIQGHRPFDLISQSFFFIFYFFG